MRRFRFTIAGLAAAIAFVAIAVAALPEATSLWDSATFTLTLGLLVVSIVLAVHRARERRAFWFGFALAGWVYLGASLLPTVETRLLSTKALASLDSIVSGPVLFPRVLLKQTQPGIFAALASAPPNGFAAGREVNDFDDVFVFSTKLGTSARTTQNFIGIGHSLIALALACAGGLFSRRLARSQGEPAHLRADEPGAATHGV